MKHNLSSIRRSRWLPFCSVAILALMLGPVALMAAPVAAPVAADLIHGPNPASFLTAGALLGGGALILREQEGKEGGGGGGVKAGEDESIDPASALEQLNDSTIPMKERLSVAGKALKGMRSSEEAAELQGKLNAANSSLKEKETELSEAKKDLSEAQSRIKALEKDAEDADEARVAAEQKAKDLAEKEQDIDARAEAKAKDRIKSLGINGGDLPAQTTSEKGTQSEEERAYEAFQKEKDPDKKAAAFQAYKTIAAKAGGADAAAN